MVLERLEQDVTVPCGEVTLDATLAIPPRAPAVVAFAHGSGSGRHSPRNRLVAEALAEAGLGTLLLDLLTGDEESVDIRTGDLRFDIPLLARRLTMACDWLSRDERSAGLALGLFGASTGAAAALATAAQRPDAIGAIVLRGGRPDLAADALPRVRAPTLLLVGGDDHPVIGLNRRAMHVLSAAPRQMEIVTGATHLFAEPGALELVAERARDWFVDHLAGDAR